MKAPKLRAVEMVRRIRDRHARQLAGKTERLLPRRRQAATDNLHQRAKATRRRTG